MKRTIGLIVTFVVIIASLMLISSKRMPQPPAPSTPQIWKASGVPVKTTNATLGSMEETVPITGDLSALNSAIVSPKISGRLTSISIHEGDHVKQGQVVAMLDQGDALNNLESAQASFESARARLAQAETAVQTTRTQTQAAIDQARANLRSAQAKVAVAKKPNRTQERMVAQNSVDSAKANLDKAQADYNRYDQLLKRGAISEADFDVVKTQHLVAQSNYKSAKDQLAQIDEGGRQEDVQSAVSQVEVARSQLNEAYANRSQNQVKEKDVLAARAAVLQAQAAVDTARRQLENTSIRCSINGYVSSRSADPGQVVSPGQTLANLVDLSSVFFKADVSENSLTQIAKGQPVTVRIDAVPGVTYRGTVTGIYPSGSTASRNFVVRISIAGLSTAIKPGMFASGDILTGKATNALLVPKDAIDEQNGTQAVYVVGADNTAKRVVVSVLRTNRQWAQVAATSNLKAGDAVVTEGLKNLQDGAKVELGNKGSKNVAH